MSLAEQQEQISSPHLPDELWLHILAFVSPSDSWLNLRHVNQQLNSCVDDFARTNLLPRFSAALTYSLGSGTKHRWYDVRATAMFEFSNINPGDPQYALYELENVLPERVADMGREKWRRMCADGLGSELEWRVRFEIDQQRATYSAPIWRVRFGIDDPADAGHSVKIPRLVVADGQHVWINWREMIYGYFQQCGEVA